MCVPRSVRRSVSEAGLAGRVNIGYYGFLDNYISCDVIELEMLHIRWVLGGFGVGKAEIYGSAQ